MLEKVRKWLAAEGYTLEMETAAAFRNAGFDVVQSNHFVDQETGKDREADVIAIDADRYGIVRAAVVIECKSSKTPWVVLTAGDNETGYNRLHAFGILSYEAQSAVIRRLAGNIDERLRWFKKGPRVGYSLRQALSGQDSAYGASIAVVKAAHSWTFTGFDSDATRIAFSFPVIVTDAPIVRCSLDAGGRIELAEIDEGEILFHTRLRNFIGTSIRIVNVSRVPAFAREAREVIKELVSELQPEIAKVLESWRNDAENADERAR